MKRKIGLALAVILVGAFVVVYAQAKGEKVEPISNPVSSSVSASSAPVATEEPAASTEPTAGDGVEDEPVDQVTEEQAPTNEGATYESDPSQSEYQETRFSELVNKYMTKWGCSQEEAEKIANDIMNSGQQAAAEEQQRLAESSAAAQERIEKEKAEAAAEADSYWMERYGITAKEAMGMSPDELRDLRLQHQGG